MHVFAPTLVCFVEWVLKEAAKEGKKRLYFLARDGYLMYRAAKILADGQQPDIELRYLKVSRFALRRAEYHLLGADVCDMLCAGGIDITFEKIMKRAALNEAEAAEIADSLRQRLPENFFQGTLSYVQLQHLKKELREIPKFLQYVNRHSLECYPDTVGYLQQEGIQEDIAYAVVDSGWIGTIQKSLEHLSGKRIEGYYFGLYELPQGAVRSQYHGYFFMPKSSIKRKVYFSNCLFEAVFSASEGMTLGYEKDGIFYKGTESGQRNPNAGWMEKNERLLEDYLKRYLQEEGTAGGHSEKTVERLLCTLMGRPKKFEAEALGNLLFCDDVLEMQMQQVAAKLPEEELKKQQLLHRLLVKSGLVKEELHESAWLFGSIVSGGKHIYRRLFQAKIYQYLMYIRKALFGK